MSKVVLYNTGCSSYKKIKSLLESSGVPFKEENVSLQMRSLNFVRIPILAVDGKKMFADAAEKWIENRTAQNKETKEAIQ